MVGVDLGFSPLTLSSRPRFNFKNKSEEFYATYAFKVPTKLSGTSSALDRNTDPQSISNFLIDRQTNSFGNLQCNR
jgi:hypothetical protein